MGEKINVRQIWTRGCLIPFWVIQLIILLIQLAVAGLLISGLGILKAATETTVCYDANYGSYYCDVPLSDSTKKAINIALGVTAVLLVIVIIAIFLEIFQIVQYCRSRMTPGSYFGQQLFLIIITTLNLIFAIVAIAQGQGGAVGSLVLAIIVWLAFLASFIYACVIFTRSKKGYYNTHDTELNQQGGGLEYKTDPAAAHQPTYETPAQQYPTYEQPQQYNAPEVNYAQHQQQPHQGGAPPYPVAQNPQY